VCKLLCFNNFFCYFTNIDLTQEVSNACLVGGDVIVSFQFEENSFEEES
jgi:hypothetical protein